MCVYRCECRASLLWLPCTSVNVLLRCVTTCMFGGVTLLSPALPMYAEVQGFKSTAEVERLLLEHGERVVGRLGVEIDRIEIKIKVGLGRGWGSSRIATLTPPCTHMPTEQWGAL